MDALMLHQEVYVQETFSALLEKAFKLFIGYLVLYNIFLILID